MGEPVDETVTEHGADDRADWQVAQTSAEPASESAAEPAAERAAERAAVRAGAPAAVGGVDPQQALHGLNERPLSEHAEVYEELHSHLQRTLAEIDGG